jgi:hypothetical protein
MFAGPHRGPPESEGEESTGGFGLVEQSPEPGSVPKKRRRDSQGGAQPTGEAPAARGQWLRLPYRRPSCAALALSIDCAVARCSKRLQSCTTGWGGPAASMTAAGLHSDCQRETPCPRVNR